MGLLDTWSAGTNTSSKFCASPNKPHEVMRLFLPHRCHLCTTYDRNIISNPNHNPLKSSLSLSYWLSHSPCISSLSLSYCPLLSPCQFLLQPTVGYQPPLLTRGTYRFGRDDRVQVVKLLKFSGVLLIKVCINGILYDAQWVVWPLVQIGSNLLKDILSHIVVRMPRDDICTPHAVIHKLTIGD